VSAAEYVCAVDGLEDLVFQQSHPFALGADEVARLRNRFAVDAFEHQIAGNPDYRRFATACGVDAEAVRAGGVDVVPLIPSSVFKQRDLLTRPLDGQARRCTSSGTQGGLSVVNRDRRTLQRFFGSVTSLMDILGVEPDRQTRFHVLGPDVDEAADLWFAYVLSIVDLVHPTSFHVRDGVFDVDGLIAELRDRPAGTQPLLIGPPALVLDLLQRVKDTCGSLDLGSDGGMVITAGGWKRASGTAVARAELTDLAVGVLHLAGPGQVRDCFNMVELNTVIATCAEHRLHVPPWLRVTARDPLDLHVLPDGGVGMLGFVDPLPTSYPGFVLSDDLGSVHYDVACACGLTSDVLEVERRLRRVESRGCALKLDQDVRR
jgi:long-chain-fatty-acid---luciferin-component ligase